MLCSRFAAGAVFDEELAAVEQRAAQMEAAGVDAVIVQVRPAESINAFLGFRSLAN